MTFPTTSTALFGALVFSCASQAEAQMPDDASQSAPHIETMMPSQPSAQDTRSFRSDFFQDYAPVTALDMITHLPGFELSAGDTSRRGLADSFGNLLIDGSRPSNKSLSLETVLQRIPAAGVLRIELLETDSPGITRHGHARLANVVLRQDIGRAGSYQLMWQHMDGGRSTPMGSASITQPFDRGEIILGAEVSLWSPRTTRQRLRSDADGRSISRSYESDQVLDQGITTTMSLNFDLDDDSSFQLDTEGYFWVYSRGFFQATETAQADLFHPSGFISSRTADHGTSYSLSGRYERELSPRLTMQSQVLASQDIMNNGPERLEFYHADTGFIRAEIYNFSDRQEEFALRQNFIWQHNASHGFEFGAEAALNRGATELVIELEQAGQITQLDLPVANTTIEEERGEVFAQHGWVVSDKLTLTSGLRWEFSQLSLGGDAVQNRSFSYLKPHFSADFRPNDTDRLRLTLRRDVDQLDFSKFASSVDIADNNATLGNPDYVPQNSWIAEVEFERRWSDSATFLMRLDHTWAQDLDDWIPVNSGGSVFDAPGNLGDGSRWRLLAEMSTGLQVVGLSNAHMDLGYTFQDTQVQDPLTGDRRNWSGNREHQFTISYRQALPAHQFNWGWDYAWRSDAVIYRASEIRVEGYPSGALNIYAETSHWENTVLRAGVRGLVDVRRNRHRTFYQGSRASNIVTGAEDRVSDHGPLVYLQLTGTF